MVVRRTERAYWECLIQRKPQQVLATAPQYYYHLASQLLEVYLVPGGHPVYPNRASRDPRTPEPPLAHSGTELPEP